jgi:hypothetical protein
LIEEKAMTTHLRSLPAPLLLALAAVVAPAAEPADARIKVGDDHLDFLAGTALVGRYHKGPEVAKPFLWPLHGPGGVAMTRAWPLEKAPPGGSTDHPHQKSAWFCHGDVIPEGLELKHKIKGVEGVDFWSEAPGHGVIACTHVGEPKQEKNHAQVTTRNEWRTADGVKVLDETRTIHLYDLGDARLFVFDIDLEPNNVPVTFGDTKEGSFGVRVNDRITEMKGKGRIANADGGVGEKACWGRRSAWCDYSGTIDGNAAGIAILDDPANRYPACWHSRGYGLMAANPFGRAKSGFPAHQQDTDLVKLGKGEHLKLRYGILVHPGDAKEGKVGEHFKEFVKLKG